MYIKAKAIVKSLFHTPKKRETRLMPDVLYLDGKAVGVRKNENSDEYLLLKGSDYSKEYLSRTVGDLAFEYDYKQHLDGK